MKTKLILLAGVALAVAFALMTAPGALAQTTRPTSGAQGSVQNGVYTWPQAGYSLSLPPLWVQYGYKWYETWGTDANALIQGARYINEWVYTPVAPGAR